MYCFQPLNCDYWSQQPWKIVYLFSTVWRRGGSPRSELSGSHPHPLRGLLSWTLVGTQETFVWLNSAKGGSEGRRSVVNVWGLLRALLKNSGFLWMFTCHCLPKIGHTYSCRDLSLRRWGRIILMPGKRVPDPKTLPGKHLEPSIPLLSPVQFAAGLWWWVIEPAGFWSSSSCGLLPCPPARAEILIQCQSRKSSEEQPDTLSSLNSITFQGEKPGPEWRKDCSKSHNYSLRELGWVPRWLALK